MDNCDQLNKSQWSYGISKKSYRQIKKEGKDITKLRLMNMVKENHICKNCLLNCSNIQPSKTKTFHELTRVFCAESAPMIDSSFLQHNVPESKLSIFTKFAGTNEFTEHVPLSVGVIFHNFMQYKLTKTWLI